jgi:hypothetical protein
MKHWEEREQENNGGGERIGTRHGKWGSIVSRREAYEAPPGYSGALCGQVDEPQRGQKIHQYTFCNFFSTPS